MGTKEVSLSPEELESVVRRVVREELRALFHRPAESIADDWRHEGPYDPAGDALALRDALATLRSHGSQPDAWMSWEDFEAELDRAEAAGELPD